MTLGEKIKRLREDKKYSQEELADLLKVHAVTISKWESGIQEPRAKRLNDIAKIFGVTSEYLLEGTNDVTKKEENNKIFIENDSKGHNLIYKWGGHELNLPDTPETRKLFEKIVLLSMGNSTSQPAMA